MENNSSYKRAKERIDQTDKMLRRLKIATKVMFVVQAVFIVVVMVLIITAIVKVVF